MYFVPIIFSVVKQLFCSVLGTYFLALYTRLVHHTTFCAIAVCSLLITTPWYANAVELCWEHLSGVSCCPIMSVRNYCAVYRFVPFKKGYYMVSLALRRSIEVSYPSRQIQVETTSNFDVEKTFDFVKLNQCWNLTLFHRLNLTLFQRWNPTLFQRWNLTFTYLCMVEYDRKSRCYMCRFVPVIVL